MTEYALTPAFLAEKGYKDRIVAIKYGGSAMKNGARRRQVMQDVAALHAGGVRVVLLHGGGPEINAMLGRLDIPSRFKDGLRVTDGATMAVVQMVLAGKVNKDLVALLGSMGAPAVGLSGVDGGLLRAEPKDPELGFVGRVTDVDTGALLAVMDAGYIPVICPVAADGDGNVYNVNADTAAAWLAGALGAGRLLLMTDTPGVLLDKDDETSLIPRLTLDQAEALRAGGVISGGMVPKAECCALAVRRGVERVAVLDGRLEHAVARFLLSGETMGTSFVEA